MRNAPDTAQSSLLIRCRLALGFSFRPDPHDPSAPWRGGAVELAELLGVDWRTELRWERGESRVPAPVWVALYFLLRETAADPELMAQLPVPAALRTRSPAYA